MFPHERSLVKQLADKPFALIGVNSDADPEHLRKAVKKKNVTWRSFWGGEHGTSGPIAVKWGVHTWPTLYVIDAKGVIRFKNRRGKELDKAITELLAEAGHEVVISHEDESDEREDVDKKAEGQDKSSATELDIAA